MAKYGHEKRDFQVGDFWLGQRSGSPAWYRMWYDEKANRTKRASLSTTNFEEAKELLTQWFIKNQNVTQAKAQDIYLAEIFTQFYEKHAKNLHSALQARIALRHWLDFFGDDTLKDAIKIDKQEQFHVWLREDKKMAHNTLHRVVAVGKSAINWAWKRDVIEHLPYVIPIPLKPAAPKGRPMEIEEIAKLFEAVQEKHLQYFILFMLATTARPEAIYELTYVQCDLQNKIISLNPAGREQTKKYRPVVKMPNSLYPIIQKGKAENSEETRVLAYKNKGISSVKTSWNKARDRAGFDKNVQPYSLCHTMARWLRKEGVPAWEVAAQLGHKQKGLSTTEIYAPFSPDYLEASVKSIDGFFDQLRVNCVGVNEILTS